jgi:NAD(P)-dependent dehydrogenase (short-subunit alcohol dehydrogenase family)
MDIRGRTALVTGGAVRVGRAICLALAGRGCAVAVHYHRSQAEAEALVGEIARQGGRAWAVPAELASEAACTNLVRDAAAPAGRLDLLVNNASLFRRERLAATTEAGLLTMFWPALFAPVLLTREFAAQTRDGHVINLLDRRVAAHDPDCLPYHLAKKALAEFTATAALELAPGIAVNGVAPGALLPPPGEGDAYLRAHRGLVPLADAGTPQAVADAILYLLDTTAVTGQILYVDGGKHLLGSTDE